MDEKFVAAGAATPTGEWREETKVETFAPAITRTSEETDQLWPAYLEALKAIDPVVKTDSEMTSSQWTHKYASRAKILSHIWKPLLKAGLILTQAPTRQGENIVVETRVTHAASGQWVSASLPAKAGETPHQVGTAVTYLQRYTLCGLIPLAADEDHDDPSVNEPAPNPFYAKAKTPPPDDSFTVLGLMDVKYFGVRKTDPDAAKAMKPNPKAFPKKLANPATGKDSFYWVIDKGVAAPEGPQRTPEEEADADALFNPATKEQQKQDNKRKGKAGWKLNVAGSNTLDKLIVVMEERHPDIGDPDEAVQAWLLKSGVSNDDLNDPEQSEAILAKARKAKP